MEPVTEHVRHLVRKKIVVRRSDNNFTCQDCRTDDIWERLEYMFLFQILQWFLDGINKNDRVGVKTWVCRGNLECTYFSFWPYRDWEIVDLAISLDNLWKAAILCRYAYFTLKCKSPTKKMYIFVLYYHSHCSPLLTMSRNCLVI